MRNLISARNAFLAAAVAASIGAADAADRPWVEVRSPHFVVLSNAGEREGREIAFQFEQGRSVFRALWPWARRENDRPFVVLAVRDVDVAKERWPATPLSPTDAAVLQGRFHAAMGRPTVALAPVASPSAAVADARQLLQRACAGGEASACTGIDKK